KNITSASVLILNWSHSVIDWSILRPTQIGVVVEGASDKKFLEAFLEAGERQQHWLDWRAKIVVNFPGGANDVIKELKNSSQPDQLWGLIDRDWRTDIEIANLQKQHSHLLILPRIMIENYLLDPDELLSFLPPTKQ